MQTAKSGSHTVWDCKYHIVWVTKYHYPVLVGDVGLRARELLREISRSYELYRLVRKQGGQQRGGWSFDFKYLHAKSGSLSPLKHFAYDMREIVRRERLPGYRLLIERGLHGGERLNFTPIPVDPLAAPRCILTRGRRHGRG
jgi:hypothetical protein